MYLPVAAQHTLTILHHTPANESANQSKGPAVNSQEGSSQPGIWAERFAQLTKLWSTIMPLAELQRWRAAFGPASNGQNTMDKAANIFNWREPSLKGLILGRRG